VLLVVMSVMCTVFWDIGILGHVVWWIFTDISEETVAIIFKAVEFTCWGGGGGVVMNTVAMSKPMGAVYIFTQMGFHSVYTNPIGLLLASSYPQLWLN
jgi:hypothetical protein